MTLEQHTGNYLLRPCRYCCLFINPWELFWWKSLWIMLIKGLRLCCLFSERRQEFDISSSWGGQWVVTWPWRQFGWSVSGHLAMEAVWVFLGLGLAGITVLGVGWVLGQVPWGAEHGSSSTVQNLEFSTGISPYLLEQTTTAPHTALLSLTRHKSRFFQLPRAAQTFPCQTVLLSESSPAPFPKEMPTPPNTSRELHPKLPLFSLYFHTLHSLVVLVWRWLSWKLPFLFLLILQDFFLRHRSVNVPPFLARPLK